MWIAQTRIFRMILFSMGWVFLAIGFVGIFVPLLPTTPFVLLAAGCFTHSSPKFQKWLYEHPYFGPAIRDWNQKGVIRPVAKAIACFSILGSMIYIYHRVMVVPVKWGVIIFLGMISLFILSRPSRR